ncbi:MAG: S-layer homology domain-containing protein [Firmicutes bacterium]|nr:S-layer homology domain-containing protein [Bacillota bacterium]
MRESISVSGNTVTIDLVYDPAGFDLSFDVIVDSSVPDELAPIAVDVQLVFYDRHNDEWTIVPGFESRTIEVALSKVDGVWQGTGTYHVWSKYTTASFKDELYLYRIAITGFELGPVRGSLSAVNSDGGEAFKVYKSQAGTYHPAAAYIANVSVSDISCTMGTAEELKGAHVYRNGSVDEQHGSITATISIDPYTVVQHYEDGVTADKITPKVFLTPFLDEPVRSGYIFDGWWTKDAHGNWDTKVSSAGLAIMDLVASGKTLDLYAKWKQDLTVCGDVQIFNWYMHKGNKTFIFDHDRIDTAIVRLVRSNGGSQTVLRVQEVSMTDVIGAGETAETADHRLGSFSFENVPDDGSEYHITIAATNFTSKFRNETVASGAAFSETLNAAVDENGDSTARVDAQMTFAPAVFDLIFTVDADAIAEGFRPDSVGLVIRGNDRLPSETQTEPLSWPIISQQKQGSNVLSHAIAMDKNTGLPVEDAHGAGSGIWHDFEVWQAHPANYFYAYALEVWDAAFGSTVYDQSNMANAPFTVAYVPVRAWYDIASGEQTVPPTVLDLGITLTHPDSSKPNGLVAYMLPKTYDLTFELGRTGSVAGITKLDADTFLDSFTWSFGKASLPTAEAEGEAGVSFGGWWTKNGRSTGDWGEKITAIPANQQGDLTLYARWIYTVTWNCANGSSPIVETLIEGTMPVEPLSPTKPATTQYTYSFTGWSPAISKVSGNSTYTAQYSSTVNSYTITWKNGSETLDTDTVAYGGTPVYSGSTPKKDSTAEFSYEFIGWTPAISSVTGDAEYSAVFSATKRSYTITWLNADGTLLDADSNVLYGTKPVYSSVHPQKAGDAQYSYSFIGWKRAGDSNIYDAVSIPVVEGDTVYTAQYEQSINKYTVIWQNYDGTELEKDENVPYGTMPSYDAAAPSRASTAQYAYHFKSWDKMIEPVSGNVTYTAEYYQQTQTYTVIWENADGTELERDTNVPYGAVPAYNGTVPVKAEDAQYSYSFDKWSPAISAVTADAVYTAEYKSTVRKYRITWLDENDTVLRSEMLEYGTTPAYGTPPAKAADAQYTYSFDKWSPDIVSVTGEASYKASYMATVNEYTVIWQNYDGTELEKDENVPYGTTPSYDGITPEKPATAQYSYSFAGWTPAIHSLTGDVVYTAAFSETVNEYVITWYDEDGITKLDEQILPFGAVPVYKGSAPQKAGDAQFSYTFNGWDSAFAPVSGNASYQASYQQHLNSYKVTWLNENGIVLETDENVPYGTVPTYDGATPTKAATAQYTYSFDKWSPDVSAVTGDAVYTAVYTSTVNEYTVIWYDEDGVTELNKQTLPFGATPVYAGLAPTKASTAQYSYSFSHWTPAVSSVIGNAHYIAAYHSTVNTYTVIWQDEDGTELEKDENVPYGTAPEFNGATPTKSATAQFTYSFKGWSPSTSDVTGNATYKAEYNTTVNKYMVKWMNEGSSTPLEVDNDIPYGAMPVYNGAVPTKAATAEYTFTFKGWSPAITAVETDTVYVAEFTAEKNKYHVVWKDSDGTILETDYNVLYGTTPEFNGATPTKAADAQYSYSFAGWTPSVSAVDGHEEYIATYSSTLRSYEVRWVNYDGTLLKSENVEYGTMPSYVGETPIRPDHPGESFNFIGWDKPFEAVKGPVVYQAKYEGNVIPYTITWVVEGVSTDETYFYDAMPMYPGSTPQKASTPEFSYTHSGWSPIIEKVKANQTYIATFDEIKRSYLITWLNEDNTLLKSENVEYGTMPTAPADPTKAADAQYSYSFAGWDNVPVAVSGNATYKATYNSILNKYDVVWKNWDGTTLETDADIEYGTVPVYDGATPTRPATTQYVYTFDKWSPAVSSVTGDVVYTATFKATLQKYIITWYDEDGSTVLDSQEVDYGSTPVYGGAQPTKAPTTQYTYSFNKWLPGIASVTGDASYTASYSAEVNKYTVTWKNADGSDLEVDSNVPYGAAPEYNGADPTKASTAQYSYSFNGWDKVLSAVTGDIIYTAVYVPTVNSYTVLWKNHNGDVLETDTVLYGDTPHYGGITPVKAATPEFSYTHSGWSPAIAEVTGNAEYTAVFSETRRSYLVTWRNDDGSVIDTEMLEYGTMPTHADASKAPTAQYSFVFAGWSPAPAAVSGEAVYDATYTPVLNKYTVTWVDENGTTVLEKDENVGYGTMPSFDSADPTKTGNTQYSYDFKGWDKAIAPVSGDITYKAVYEPRVNEYTITWKNDSGTVLKSEKVAYGSTPVFTDPDPAKPASAEFTYSFKGWSPAISAVSGDAEYIAEYDATKRSYLIIWQNEDGSSLHSESVEYGEQPVYAGAVPTKAPTARYSYIHNGWAPAVATVTGDAVYKATYTMQINQYTVTWLDDDDSILRQDTLDYDTMPSYGADPTKASDAQYSYEFKEWTPAVSAVIGNVEYKASYTPTLRSYSIVWKNWDGSMLDADVADYGTIPSYTGSTPQRAGDAQFTYSFKGWTPAVVSVTGDAEYLAEYDASVNEYTVKWVNWDDTPLETDHNVPYGTVPTYDGAAPTRPDTVEHIFTWNLWDKTVSAVTGDITYKAVFVDSANTYTVVWKNYDGAVLKTDLNVPYGAVPSYTGSTPQKPGNAQYNYSFKGWTPAITAVAGNAEYQAVFDENLNNFSITYTDGVDNAVIFPDQQYVRAYGENTPVFIGVPSRDGYSFRGWTPDVADKVTSTAVYAAVWQVASSVIFPPEVLTGTAELVKVDADDVNTRLANVSFELYHANGAYVGSYKTAADGRITVRNLDPGEYYWVETLPAEGYLLDSSKHSFYVEKDKTTSMTVTNTHSKVPSVFSNKHYAYIIGYADGIVRPEDNITRAEVATIFFRLLSEEERARYMTDENQFTDVQEGMWFNRAVSTISAMGIINGYPDHTFRPGAYITRAEFAALAARFDVNGKTTGDFFFDIEGHWAEDEIKTTTNNGWILGYEDKSFRPDRHITRAEAMALVNRLLQRVPETKSDLLEDMSVWNDNMDSEKWYYLAVQEATNSHEYVRKSNGHETWTEMLKNPDWTALER